MVSWEASWRLPEDHDLEPRLSWKCAVTRYEADPRHAEKISIEMGLGSDSKGLDKPRTRETAAEVENNDGCPPMSPADATLAARAVDLSLDRPDVQHSVKEVCRDMAALTANSRAKLKRVARYLLEYLRLEWRLDRGLDNPCEHEFWLGRLPEDPEVDERRRGRLPKVALKH